MFLGPIVPENHYNEHHDRLSVITGGHVKIYGHDILKSPMRRKSSSASFLSNPALYERYTLRIFKICR